MILGDFNFVDNDIDRTNKKNIGKNHLDNVLSEIWTEYVHEADLTDPFRKRNPKRRMFSYIHTQNDAKSRLDRVYVNDENCDTILHYRHTPTPWKKAHKVVSFSIRKH